MKIALAHDLAEAIVGDITPHDGVSADEKHTRERKVMTEIRDELGDEAGQELFELWHEYEQGKTPEAVVVKQFDKLEMLIQADEYEKGVVHALLCCSFVDEWIGQKKDLSEFFSSTPASLFTDTTVGAIYRALMEERSTSVAHQTEKVKMPYQ